MRITVGIYDRALRPGAEAGLPRPSPGRPRSRGPRDIRARAGGEAVGGSVRHGTGVPRSRQMIGGRLSFVEII